MSLGYDDLKIKLSQCNYGMWEPRSGAFL